MKTTVKRLLELFCRYSDYFSYFLSHYYPFTSEQLEKYLQGLDWESLSRNLFLEWDKTLLMEYAILWDWYSIGEYIVGIKGLSDHRLIEELVDDRILLKWSLIRNERIVWSKELIKAIGLENEFYLNRKINGHFIWNAERVEKTLEYFAVQLDGFGSPLYDVNTLSRYADVEWTDEMLNMHHAAIDYLPEVGDSTMVDRVETINEGGFPWQYKYEREIKVATKPKEVEDIISVLEKYGDRLATGTDYQKYTPICYRLVDGVNVEVLGNDEDAMHYYRTFIYPQNDYFLFNNPEGLGVDFTFNTPEKRKMLDEAVEEFYNWYSSNEVQFPIIQAKFKNEQNQWLLQMKNKKKREE